MAFGTILPSRGTGAGAAAIAWALAAAFPVAAEDAKVAAPQRTVLFASIDAGSSGFATVGAKRTLIGTLDESGPVALASIGAGGSPERMRSLQLGDAAFRPAVQASALVGYQWALGRIFLSLFAGPELDRDRF